VVFGDFFFSFLSFSPPPLLGVGTEIPGFFPSFPFSYLFCDFWPAWWREMEKARYRISSSFSMTPFSVLVSTEKILFFPFSPSFFIAPPLVEQVHLIRRKVGESGLLSLLFFFPVELTGQKAEKGEEYLKKKHPPPPPPFFLDPTFHLWQNGRGRR